MMNERTTDGPATPGRHPDEPPAPATMTAIVHHAYGGADVLTTEEVPTPRPGPGQVQIRVEASSMNVYDLHMITGTPMLVRAVAGWRRPNHHVPGADVAGVVTAVGDDVVRFEPGDRVFGDIGHGAFAPYAVTDEPRIALLPRSVPFEHAAAVPLAGMTALQGLRDIGHLRPGDRVLINGATGGVGTHAVQLARILGASHVTGVCSTAKLDMVRALGADDVIDYTRHDFTEIARGYDLLFDNVGDRPWSQTRRVLTPRGRNVTTTGPKHRWFGPIALLVSRRLRSIPSHQRFTWFTARVRSEDLDTLGALMGTGELSPVIERTFPLAAVPEAFTRLADGHARGKLVITL